MDPDDRDASVTISGGMVLLLAGLLALHFGGFRFAGGVSGGITL